MTDFAPQDLVVYGSLHLEGIVVGPGEPWRGKDTVAIIFANLDPPDGAPCLDRTDALPSDLIKIEGWFPNREQRKERGW